MLRRILAIPKSIILFAIKIYQYCISPYMMSHCRFYPTCSEYSKTAFLKYNFAKAFRLSVMRILKCNPLSKGGIDLP